MGLQPMVSQLGIELLRKHRWDSSRKRAQVEKEQPRVQGIEVLQRAWRSDRAPLG